MTLPPLPLLLAGAAMLLMGGSATLWLSRNRANEARATRLRSVLGPYRRVGPPRRDLAQSLMEHLPWLRHWLMRLLGIDMRHHGDYPMAWWVVVAGALVAARACAWMAALIFNDLPQLLPVPVLWVLLCRLIFGNFAARRRSLLYRQFPDALGM